MDPMNEKIHSLHPNSSNSTDKNHSMNSPIEKPLVEQSFADQVPPNEGRNLLIAIGVILAVTILFLTSIWLYPKVAGQPLSIDELHQKNLAGDLSPEEGYIYRGYSFVKTEGLWWASLNRYDTLVHIRLQYGPRDLEDIPILGSLNSSFNRGPVVYQAINPTVQNKYYTLALVEINSNIVQGVNRGISTACTQIDPLCDNRTIVSCANTQGLPVIELAIGEPTQVELIGSCIKIQGQDDEIVKAAERMLYKWYDVME